MSTEEYTLTPEEQEVVERFSRQANEFQAKAAGAIEMIGKQHGMEGNLVYKNGKLKRAKE